MTQTLYFNNPKPDNRISTMPWDYSGSVVECLTRDQGATGFKPHRRHCVASLNKTN